MTKIEKYRSLVEKRKSCQLCNNITNPSKIENGIFDSDEIGPWSRWQGNLYAELLIVGQDWGDITYFKDKDNQGRDIPSGNKSNENLQKLLAYIGIQIGKPREIQEEIVFFTNLILCIKKKGGLSGRIKSEWLMNCAVRFFPPLVEIIQPKVIIGLGKDVSTSILKLYQIKYPKNSFAYLIEQSPYRLTNSMIFFSRSHCGYWGVRNRWRYKIGEKGRKGTEQDYMDLQKADWIRVKEWFDNC
jgi:DNA polymerase